MSLVDRLRECDRHDLRDFRPLWIGGLRCGWLRPSLMRMLLERPPLVRPARGGVALADTLDSYAARSEAVHTLLLELRDTGVVADWWDEPCAVVPGWGKPPLMQVERAGLDLFGFKSFGVHLNGYVRTAGGVELWIARRARGRSSFPGRLDHLAAGGQPLGLTPSENMVKECGEEAGIPADLAGALRRAGALAYRCDLPGGLNDDRIFVFDLELPEDFEPRNEDGEVESFERMTVGEVLDRMRGTRDFKFNVPPVILDFLLRHGWFPERDPEYEALGRAVASMRREP